MEGKGVHAKMKSKKEIWCYHIWRTIERQEMELEQVKESRSIGVSGNQLGNSIGVSGNQLGNQSGLQHDLVQDYAHPPEATRRGRQGQGLLRKKIGDPPIL